MQWFVRSIPNQQPPGADRWLADMAACIYGHLSSAGRKSVGVHVEITVVDNSESQLFIGDRSNEVYQCGMSLFVALITLW